MSERQNLIDFSVAMLRSHEDMREEWLYPSASQLYGGISPAMVNYICTLFPGQMAVLPSAFVLKPMRKIVYTCWGGCDTEDSRCSIREWAAEVAQVCLSVCFIIIVPGLTHCIKDA